MSKNKQRCVLTHNEEVPLNRKELRRVKGVCTKKHADTIVKVVKRYGLYLVTINYSFNWLIN
jgi:hypothetical protein